MTEPIPNRRPPVILVLCTLAALVALVFVIAARGQEEVEASFPGTNGKIAFSSVRNGEFDIFTMNADGSNQKQLTQNLGIIPISGLPAWSPDGQKIAFTTLDFATAVADINMMNADGSALTNLTSGLGLQPVSPAFSPDGSKIVFANLIGTQFQIYVMNIDGTGITNLSNSATTDNQPDWSPDGSKIAFHRLATPGMSEIFVMNADGTNQKNLSNNVLGIDQRPSWSPDGSSIAFNRNTGTSEAITYDIFTMNPDGTGATNLTNTPGGIWEVDPSWSPDGTKIAFYTIGTGGDFPDIYVMNKDGSAITRLTDDPLQDVEPAWQPIPLPPTATPTPTATDTPTITPTPTVTATPTITPTKQPDPGDTDGDGCSDQRENGPNATLGGQRDYQNPWDFYDAAGSPSPPQNGAPDGIIDLPNDILGVIQHHPAGTLGYDAQFDRGPWTGPNSWNETQGPDGVIDLPNDILGVILQFGHSCQ